MDHDTTPELLTDLLALIVPTAVSTSLLAVLPTGAYEGHAASIALAAAALTLMGVVPTLLGSLWHLSHDGARFPQLAGAGLASVLLLQGITLAATPASPVWLAHLVLLGLALAAAGLTLRARGIGSALTA